MKNIIILDVQKGYLDNKNNELIEKLNLYLKTNNFNHVIFTMITTNFKDNLYKNIFWDGIYDKQEQKIALKKPMHSKVFKKKVPSLTMPILNYLKENNITQIELCGLNNFNSINLATKILKTHNIQVTILNDYIYNSKIENMKDNVDYMPNILKTLNGFYFGDMIFHAYKSRSKTDTFPYLKQNTAFSDCTILSCAMIEWLINTQHESKDMLNTVNYYYKLFPNKNNETYTQNFEAWAKNGCRTFRHANDNIALRMCTPISWYARTLEQIDLLIKNGVLPIQNNSDAELGSRLICYAIFLLRIGANRFNLAKKLKKYFNMDFFSDISTLVKQKQEPTCTNIAYLSILIFTQTSTYIDALKTALNFDCDKKVLLCTTSIIAEFYYRCLPHYDIFNCRKNLPPKFVNLLMEFSNYYFHF